MPHSLIGNCLLGIALGTAVAQILLLVRPGGYSAPSLLWARRALLVHAASCELALLTIAHALLVNDFSLRYVASHSNTQLPVFYRLAATWGAHEGSLLLWLTLLSLWSVLSVWSAQKLPVSVQARFIAWLGVLSASFVAFTWWTSSPFTALFPVPIEGLSLNPLLQDPGQVIHPPMLYTGYVGFVIPFAFALAVLPERRLERAWAMWLRTWTLAPWMFLTVGITLGSWWAYRELGWGGYWFWDPVENASLMPWLLGTALIHSLIVVSKQGLFQRWTIVLALLSFTLCLIGFFLVRSGVLVSVHAFANDPARGEFILGMLTAILLVSWTLFALHGRHFERPAGSVFFSRETFLLMNNVMLLAAAGIVILGTLYPLVLEVLTDEKISVGVPYFNRTVSLPMMPLLLMMGIGIHLAWRAKRHPNETQWLWLLVALAATLGILPFIFISWRGIGWIGIISALWVMSSVAFDIYQTFSQQKRGSKRQGARLGMWIAHTGFALIILSVCVDTTFQTTRDLTLTMDQPTQLAKWQLTLKSIEWKEGPNYIAQRGAVDFQHGDQHLVLYPEKRFYDRNNPPMTEAAISIRWWGDIYIALGDNMAPDVWNARVLFKPMVEGIWLGGFLVGFGGLVTLLKGMRRRATE